jgi:hypothetical protein
MKPNSIIITKRDRRVLRVLLAHLVSPNDAARDKKYRSGVNWIFRAQPIKENEEKQRRTRPSRDELWSRRRIKYLVFRRLEDTVRT